MSPRRVDRLGLRGLKRDMPEWARRWAYRLIWGIAALAVLAWAGARLHGWWLSHYGAGWTRAPEDAPWLLPKASHRLIAQAFAPGRMSHRLIEQAFAPAQGRPVIDHRVRVISRGQLSGPHFENRSRERGSEPPTVHRWLTRRLRDSAAGIVDPAHADAEYAERLIRQLRAMPGPYRADLFAQDAVFDAKGRPISKTAEPRVTNRYVVWLAGHLPDRMQPVVSIHPRRPDAAKRLAHWAGKGVHAVVWYPVAQRIALDGKAARALYPVMAAHHLQLVISIGALTRADGHQGWVAPDAIRPALKAGVAVRVRLGGAVGPSGQRLMPRLFRLLRRLPDKTRSRLTISLADVLDGRRARTELEPLLSHPAFFDRLRYASGYPRTARADAIDLNALAGEGFIDAASVGPLHAIYDVNPLLYAFVVMREVHLPGTDLRLPASVFFGSHEKQK